MAYTHFPQRPEILTPEFVEREYDRILEKAEAAESAEKADLWFELMREWNAFGSYIGSEGSRRNHHLNRNMFDEEAEESMNTFRRSISPVFERGEEKLTAAVLQSRHLPAIEEEFGSYRIERLHVAQANVAAVNSELRVAERDLINRYTKMMAGAEVELDGERLSLQSAGSRMNTPDEEVRKEAWRAVRGYFDENREEFGEIFDRMVAIRHEMAQNLGYDTYVPLGYSGMLRTDYGPKESAEFRAQILKHIVPVNHAATLSDAAEHGTEMKRPWDASYIPSRTIPRGVVPVERQLDLAEKFFDEVAPQLSHHFRRMREEDLIDLENRKGKRSGAYCTTFPDEGRVAILCNSVGDAGDIRTLIHEMGHAFQGWESQAIESVSLRRPTSDAAELHSMGLEHIGLKRSDIFFDEEQSRRFRRTRLIHSLNILCYVCVVDEFQHWVYENPEADPREREEKWSEIVAIYLPGVDYSGYEEFEKTIWYGQGHIFWRPFYYIDYAIAEIGAIQLGMVDREDPERAMKSYVDLCRLGGQKSVLGIFASAGLRSPFGETDLFEEIAGYLAEELALEPVDAP